MLSTSFRSAISMQHDQWHLLIELHQSTNFEHLIVPLTGLSNGCHKQPGHDCFSSLTRCIVALVASQLMRHMFDMSVNNIMISTVIIPKLGTERVPQVCMHDLAQRRCCQVARHQHDENSRASQDGQKFNIHLQAARFLGAHMIAASEGKVSCNR